MNVEGSSAKQAGVIRWSKRIPLLTNIFMLKDLAILYVLTCTLFFVLLAGGSLLAGYDLNFIGVVVQVVAIAAAIFLVLMVIACLVVMLNRMDLSFEVDDKGLTMSVGSRERKLNRLTIIVATLAGSPSALGAGLMAATQEDYFASWNSIRKVKAFNGKKVITVRTGATYWINVYCTDENFDAVKKAIREHARKAKFEEK